MKKKKPFGQKSEFRIYINIKHVRWVILPNWLFCQSFKDVVLVEKNISKKTRKLCNYGDVVSHFLFLTFY